MALPAGAPIYRRCRPVPRSTDVTPVPRSTDVAPVPRSADVAPVPDLQTLPWCPDLQTLPRCPDLQTLPAGVPIYRGCPGVLSAGVTQFVGRDECGVTYTWCGVTYTICGVTYTICDSQQCTCVLCTMHASPGLSDSRISRDTHHTLPPATSIFITDAVYNRSNSESVIATFSANDFFQ